MNYIHQLQEKVANRDMALDDALIEVEAALEYLCSSKFDQDPTVQVREVIERFVQLRLTLQVED